MHRPGIALAAALSLTLPMTALAQAPGAAGNPGTAGLAPPKDAPPIVAGTKGPYAVTIEANPGLMTHTIYRPADLKPFRVAKRLPIVAWGNGACSNAGLLFETFLSTLASHGYMIIVSGPKDAPLPAFATARAGQPRPAPGGPPQPMTKDADLIKAVDWAIAETAKPDSPYSKRLDPAKVAVMGQSCGGLQATVAAADPRVKTAMIWNSGVFANATAGVRSMSGATKASLKAFHAPVAYINGGPADAAYVNTVDDIKHIEGVPVFSGWVNVGHGGTFNHPAGGRFADAGVAWLDWRLKGSKAAAKWFEGADCGLCKDPVWHVDKKGMR